MDRQASSAPAPVGAALVKAPQSSESASPPEIRGDKGSLPPWGQQRPSCHSGAAPGTAADTNRCVIRDSSSHRGLRTMAPLSLLLQGDLKSQKSFPGEGHPTTKTSGPQEGHGVMDQNQEPPRQGQSPGPVPRAESPTTWPEEPGSCPSQ